MPLPNVSTGDPHVAAHNAERAAINAHETGIANNAAAIAANGVAIDAVEASVGVHESRINDQDTLIASNITVINAAWDLLTPLNTEAVRNTLVDAKGELVVGTADNVVDNLAAPTVNGQVLLSDSAQSAGVRWSEGLYLRGAGIPESFVTAPIGSRYIDTNATCGAIEWIKASGSGNTGWEVVYGDTGWRDITSLLVNGWTATQARVRRNGENIYFWFLALVSTSATADTVLTLPIGFRPHFVQRFPVIDTTVNRQLNVDGVGGVRILSYTTGDGSIDAYSAAWLAAQSAHGVWPTELPGTAV